MNILFALAQGAVSIALLVVGFYCIPKRYRKLVPNWAKRATILGLFTIVTVQSFQTYGPRLVLNPAPLPMFPEHKAVEPVPPLFTKKRERVGQFDDRIEDEP